MIFHIRPLPAGTAVQFWLAPPAGARLWRVLKKGVDSFLGHDDPDAVNVLESRNERVFTDTAVVNGAAVYYKPYYWNGTAWSTAPTASAIPAFAVESAGPDPLLFVRQRLDDGLRAMVAANVLAHPKGQIQVLATLPSVDQVVLPVVTVSLQREAPQERAMGDRLDPTGFDEDAMTWHESMGWWARVQLNVTGWCWNVEERIALRRAIRGVVIANQPVFEAVGLHEIEFSQEDVDDAQSFSAPMFSTVGTFVCVAAAGVEYEEDAIREVESVLTAVPVALRPIERRAG